LEKIKKKEILKKFWKEVDLFSTYTNIKTAVANFEHFKAK